MHCCRRAHCTVAAAHMQDHRRQHSSSRSGTPKGWSGSWRRLSMAPFSYTAAYNSWRRRSSQHRHFQRLQVWRSAARLAVGYAVINSSKHTKNCLL